MKTKTIIIEPYNPKWKEEFQKIKERINSFIGDLALRIEHVGSISVEGLQAKPIIDIDVVIDSYAVFPEIKKALESEGYIHEGDLGVEGREAFKYNENFNFMPYHLYVCVKDRKGYLEHIAFRDYLRTHDEAKDKYGELKIGLAKLYRHDAETYCDKKTDFVKDILSKTIYKEV